LLISLYIGILSIFAAADVVGGQEVPAGEHQEVVAITLMGHGLHCSGVLIEPNIVLTAAHCLTEDLQAYRIYVGRGKEQNFWRLDTKFQGQYKVKAAYAHPSYFDEDGNGPYIYEEKDRFDVGFMVLERRVKGVKAAKWNLDKTRIQSAIQNQEMAKIVGFGIQLPYFTTGNIPVGVKHYIEKPVLGYRNPYLQVDGNKNDSCQMDSGGPLFLKNHKDYEVVALVSTKYDGDCGDPSPSLYAPLFEVKKWLLQKVKDHRLKK